MRFIHAAIHEARVVQRHIESMHEIDLKPVWEKAEKANTTDPFIYARWRTIATLESAAMEKRYHQASAIMMSRVYIIFLGFVTGVVMALVGATFILGKLEVAEARLASETLGWKANLQTGSPGLALAFLGTV